MSSDLTLRAAISFLVSLRTDRCGGTPNRTSEIEALSPEILDPLIPNASKAFVAQSGQSPKSPSEVANFLDCLGQDCIGFASTGALQASSTARAKI